MIRLVKGCAELLLSVACTTLIAYLILSRIPIDPILAQLSDLSSVNPDLIREYRERFSLISGVSMTTHRLVIYDIIDYLPATLYLATVAFCISIVSSIAIAIFMPRTAEYIAVTCTSMPTFLLGYLFLLVFYGILGWIPSPGNIQNPVTYIIVPAIVLAITVMGPMIQIVHSALQETLRQDYIRTARSKGISEYRVIFIHALLNALAPILTSFGLIYASLLSGTIMTETIFAWPGLGSYVYLIVSKGDTNAILVVTMLLATIYFGIMRIVEYYR